MKIFWRLIVVLVIAIPIIVCWKALQTVWQDDELSYNNNDDVLFSGELEQVEQMINDEEKKVTASNLGDGVEFDITGINIVSKVYENAEVSISLANVYKDHNENSEILGKLEKGSLITIQKYDNGWSTVTNYTLSGWMKTENIKLPSTENNMTLVSDANAKVGVVKVSDSLNVRESASTSGKKIKSLSNGTVVTILESSNGWYKIQVEDTIGWASADYITVK